MKRINAGYFIKEGIRNTFLNGFMGLASIAILVSCLIIIGLFLLMSDNIELNLKNIEEQNEIVAFVDEVLSIEQAKALKTSIDSVSNVKESIFVTNAEALKSFENQFEDAGDILAEIENDNPLRHSYRIFVTDIGSSNETAESIAVIPGIIKIRHNEFVTNNIISLRNVFSVITIAFFLLLFALSIFIIYNTIRLATQARSKEINIMKFVGATNSFIRWPFIIEGLIIGVVAATLAYFSSWYIYTYFVDQVFAGINIVKLLTFESVRHTLLMIYYGVGLFIGIVGSLLAIRKYLDV